MAETSLIEAGASAASTAAALENLQVEASCSVCLEYLKEPVIIECGHNFCKACITRWWEDLERDFPCPVCRKTSRYRSLRPNRQLGSMVEIAKQLQAVKRKIRDESLCSQHHEALSLFCNEDQEAVCLICAISHTHRAHTVVPLDDATQEYKVGIQTHDASVGREYTLRVEGFKLLRQGYLFLYVLLRTIYMGIQCIWSTVLHKNSEEYPKISVTYCKTIESSEYWYVWFWNISEFLFCFL